MRACARSAGLALEYVAARARLRSEVRESAAVRARIAAARYRERRRRLERNLHDGAQQRLVALGVMLAAGGRSQPGDQVAAYHREIDAALAELRTVARGLFPASLGEAGISRRLCGNSATTPGSPGSSRAASSSRSRSPSAWRSTNWFSTRRGWGRPDRCCGWRSGSVHPAPARQLHRPRRPSPTTEDALARAAQDRSSPS